MKIVIDIPQGLKDVFEHENVTALDIEEMRNAIKNGTPLPRGHGRLIDADETLKAMDTWDKFGFEHTGVFVRKPKDDFIKYVHYDDMVKSIRGAETIIEADRTESEDKQ